jgi:site-specific recombinase XerD
MDTPFLCHRARHGPRRPPLLRAAPARPEPLGQHHRQLLESVHQAERYLTAHGRTLLDARRGDLEAFLADLLTRRAPGTVATRHKVLRILYRWLEEEEEIDDNPMARVKPPIVPDQPVPVVPEDGLRRLLAVCAGKSFEARRDTAMIMFLLDTGARRAEVAGLRLADLDFDLDVALVPSLSVSGEAATW